MTNPNLPILPTETAGKCICSACKVEEAPRTWPISTWAFWLGVYSHLLKKKELDND